MKSANGLLIAALLCLASPALLCLAPPALGQTVPAESAACDCEAPAPVQKVPPEQYPRVLQEARRAIEDIRYPRALSLLKSIGDDAPVSVRVEALELTATVHLIAGRAAVAQPLLEELYFLAPAFELNDRSLGPRVTKMFEEEAARPHKRAVSLKLREHGDDERDWVLLAGGATKRVDLACRSGANGSFAPLTAKMVKTDARFRLPNVGTFHCHAIALDGDGLPLGRFGNAERPQVITTTERGTSLVESPWFWVGLGGGVVVAVAGIVTAVVLTRPADVPDADVTVEPQQHVAGTVWSW